MSHPYAHESTPEEEAAQPLATMVLGGDSYSCYVIEDGSEVFDNDEYLVVVPPTAVVRDKTRMAEIRAKQKRAEVMHRF